MGFVIRACRVDFPPKFNKRGACIIQDFRVTDSPTESSDEDEESGHLKFQLTPRIVHKRNLEKKGSR